MKLYHVDVQVTDLLPIHPSAGEVGRRIVRHGLADVLRWLGEDPGPPPDEPTVAAVAVDPANPRDPIVFVAREYAPRLVVTDRVWNAGDPVGIRWKDTGRPVPLAELGGRP